MCPPPPPVQGCIRSHPPPRDALERKGPQQLPQRRLDRRLEGLAKAVGSGYFRLQMPLGLALAVRGTVAGHRLGALEGGGVHPPFQCIPDPPCSSRVSDRVPPPHSPTSPLVDGVELYICWASRCALPFRTRPRRGSRTPMPRRQSVSRPAGPPPITGPAGGGGGGLSFSDAMSLVFLVFTQDGPGLCAAVDLTAVGAQPTAVGLWPTAGRRPVSGGGGGGGNEPPAGSAANPRGGGGGGGGLVHRRRSGRGGRRFSCTVDVFCPTFCARAPRCAQALRPAARGPCPAPGGLRYRPPPPPPAPAAVHSARWCQTRPRRPAGRPPPTGRWGVRSRTRDAAGAPPGLRRRPGAGITEWRARRRGRESRRDSLPRCRTPGGLSGGCLISPRRCTLPCAGRRARTLFPPFLPRPQRSAPSPTCVGCGAGGCPAPTSRSGGTCPSPCAPTYLVPPSRSFLTFACLWAGALP